ncbi:hypothetical protein JCM14244_09980 [Venenivibrio stagnispumantis]|uniref:Uncharacterized conserved protein n=2 Tax=Venenivibrio stagnispumantis TaxID=407998 RepID=A0AA45WMG6_9AQUI|nr:DUF4912 domain-containing protein [Venenivibrio stagnispumantis]SMP14328.1 Uncharacterized conserved protein [Venenivibrio stagnispumantis]
METNLFCPKCFSDKIVKYGKQRGKQRYKCKMCGKTFMEKMEIKEKKKKIKSKIKLIKESLKEDKVSSHIGYISDEVAKESFIKEDYQIPENYNINRIVLLPVNPSKHFCYFEVEDRYKNENFALKLFVENEEILDIDIDINWGKYYINYHAPFKRLYVVFGIKKDGKFIPFLKSNEITAPSDEISEIPEESLWISKLKGWREIIKKSYDKTFISEEKCGYEKKLKKRKCEHESKLKKKNLDMKGS